MNILVTLNSGLGADTGPNFNLTADGEVLHLVPLPKENYWQVNL